MLAGLLSCITNMDIWNRLEEVRTLYKSELHFTGIERAPDAAKFRAMNAGASEHETTTLVVAMVYALKPFRILESGCYTGQTTRVLGQVAKTYGGSVVAMDVSNDLIEIAIKEVEGLPVEIIWCDSTRKDIENIPYGPFDFIFCDCIGPRERHIAFENLIKLASPGAWAAVHDVAKHHGGHERYVPFFESFLLIPVPRGLMFGKLAARSGN